MSGLMNNTPFFIIGNPRSGTSLLRLMLNSHPQMTVPPECGFALWLYDRYKDQNPADPAVVNAYIADVCASRKFETWGLEQGFIQEFARNSQPTDYPALASLIYRSYAAQQGKQPQLVGDKNNYYIKHLGELGQAFPQAKIVFIVRDGRDVACSYRNLKDSKVDSKYKPDLPYDMQAIAQEWVDNNQAVLSVCNDDVITVRYEDLLVAPQEQLTRICSFLGLAFDEAMLQYHAKNDEPAELMQWKAKTLEAPDVANFGKYKTELSAAEIAAFEAVAGATLERFGYAIGQ